MEVTGRTVYASNELDDQIGGRDGDFGGGNVNESAADDTTVKNDTAEKDAAQETTKETDYKCGWGFLTPNVLQKFLKIEYFLATCCCLAYAHGMVGGLISVVLSTIERRFELNSMQCGMIATAYDISSIVCLIPVSFYGELSHKPRWMASGSVILGIGSLMFASPHFMAGSYSYSSTFEDQVKLCGSTEHLNCSLTENVYKQMDPSNYLYVMFFAHMLHGVGASPLFTLAVTFIDENTSNKNNPTYLAIYYSMVVLGPASGHIIGGQTLKYFVEIGKETSLTPDDQGWLGAWWIGFLITAIIFFVVSMMLFAFPMELPGRSKVELEKKMQKIKIKEDFGESDSKILKPQDIFASMKILLLNPVFGMINLCCSAEGALISGFVTFSPKFVEFSYNVHASSAAQLIGVCTIVSGVLGIVIGGYLVKRFNMGGLASLKMGVIVIASGLVLCLLLLVRCQDMKFVGINFHYGETIGTSELAEVNLTASCNADCRCLPTDVDPICGPDSITYVSACHAGCREFQMLQNGRKKHYRNCSCISSYLGNSQTPGNFSAVQGMCEGDCNLLAFFMAFYSVNICLMYVICTPFLIATLSCVLGNQKSLALGCQMIVTLILGVMPSPIIFGSVIDMTCLYWNADACSDKAGSCLLYTSERMGVYLFCIVLFFKSLSLLFVSLAYLFMKRMINSSASRFQNT